ncbi:MAG: hypothetical protein ACKOGJ_01240, partial [Phycisphaerales bacterium]
ACRPRSGVAVPPGAPGRPPRGPPAPGPPAGPATKSPQRGAILTADDEASAGGSLAPRCGLFVARTAGEPAAR